MAPPETLLVLLVRLAERMPLPATQNKPERGRPKTYTDGLFLKALVIMIVRRLHKVHELLTVLEQPTVRTNLVCLPAISLTRS